MDRVGWYQVPIDFICGDLMVTILSLYLFANTTEASESWVIKPHQLSQVDLWLETAHGIEDRDTPVTIFVEVDEVLIPLDTYLSTVPAVPEKYPHWQVDDVPSFPMRIGVDQPSTAFQGVKNPLRPMLVVEAFRWLLGKIHCQFAPLEGIGEGLHDGL